MLRFIKILLIISVALWGIFGAIGNFSDWEGTVGAVEATTTMSTFDPGAHAWRATSNRLLIMIGAILIPLAKIATGLLCLTGAWRMWKARAGDASEFAQAKTLALAGCGVALFFLFTGWIVIAETWFELWQSEVFRDAALNSAFRYGGFIALIALFVGARED